MEIKIFTENGKVPVTVIHVDGNIDASSHEAFLAKARQLINEGSRHILLDLSHTTFISSAGWRAIQTVFNELRALHPDANLSEDDMKKGIATGTYKSPHLKLLNLSKDVQAIFSTTGFDLFLESFTDLKEAVASF